MNETLRKAQMAHLVNRSHNNSSESFDRQMGHVPSNDIHPNETIGLTIQVAENDIFSTVNAAEKVPKVEATIDETPATGNCMQNALAKHTNDASIETGMTTCETVTPPAMHHERGQTKDDVTADNITTSVDDANANGSPPKKIFEENDSSKLKSVDEIGKGKLEAFGWFIFGVRLTNFAIILPH